MPFVQLQDIRLHYEVIGQGPPLVMLMGLRGGQAWFYRQIPELSQYFQLILVDNRGSGLSGKPDAPYTVTGMAADTIGLLEAINLESAHFLGISLGGCIAQEVALSFPQKVKGLILACTTCGGSEALALPKHVLARFDEQDSKSHEDALRSNLRILFSDRYLNEQAQQVEAFVTVAIEDKQPMSAFRRQVEALRKFSSARHLPGLTQPTLITTGSDDGFIPAENSMILAGLIPDSSLTVFPKGRHCFFIEMAGRFNREAISFLHQFDRA